MCCCKWSGGEAEKGARAAGQARAEADGGHILVALAPVRQARVAKEVGEAGVPVRAACLNDARGGNAAIHALHAEALRTRARARLVVVEHAAHHHERGARLCDGAVALDLLQGIGWGKTGGRPALHSTTARAARARMEFASREARHVRAATRCMCVGGRTHQSCRDTRDGRSRTSPMMSAAGPWLSMMVTSSAAMASRIAMASSVRLMQLAQSKTAVMVASVRRGPLMNACLHDGSC